MLYGGVALATLIACIYLCLRRGNAFAPDITPPLVLRLWAAAFFAFAFLSHIWWFLFYKYSGDLNSVSCAVVAVIDYLCLLISIAGTLLAMLQDRKRPVWPLVVAMLPYMVLLTMNVVFPDRYFLYIAVAYLMGVFLFFFIYMLFAVRQYGRWLRDNYADLEHKEVWVSHVLIIFILILFIFDGFGSLNIIISYFVQAVGLVLFSFLLWRVETLPQLEGISADHACSPSALESSGESEFSSEAQQAPNIPSNIEQLLDEFCVGTQLYLQHDLTLHQLAQAIGTNRCYLGQYFSSHGTTYNAYINDLRINHFMNLYREATAAQQSITAQQLASDSGYRSYSTFSLAFKQRMGESVTAWMRKNAM